MTPRRAFLAILAALLVVTIGRLHASFPAVVMIYGGSLQKPVIIGGVSATELLLFDGSRPKPVSIQDISIDRLQFLYPPHSERAPKLNLSQRPFFGIAQFWGGDFYQNYVMNPDRLPELKPEGANRHGRLYPPSGGEPAITLQDGGGGRRGSLVPIPTDLEGFPYGRVLSDADAATLRRLGIPGF